MADYPINQHVLAEDFRKQQAGQQAYNQGDGEWLMDALHKMCEAYDKALDELEEARRDLDFSVCYSPGAIRDSFDSYEEDDENAQWVEQATDEQLKEVAGMILSSDPVWRDFHRNIEMCVEDVRTSKE